MTEQGGVLLKYRVNLLPIELQSKRFNFKLFFIITILTTLIVLALIFTAQHVKVIYQKNAQLQEKIAKLKREYKMEQQIANHMEMLIQERRKWEQKWQIFIQLIDDRQKWSDLFKKIHNCVPDDLWFEKIEIKYDGIVDKIYTENQENAELENIKTEQIEDESETALTDKISGKISDMSDKIVDDLISDAAQVDDNNTVSENIDGDKLSDISNEIIITGKSLSMESIGKFTYKLNHIKYGDISLTNIKLIEIKRELLQLNETLADGEQDVLSFVIRAELQRINTDTD